jgi:Flp pilus assembly protein TadD
MQASQRDAPQAASNSDAAAVTSVAPTAPGADAARATLQRLASLVDEAFKCQSAGQLADAIALYDAVLAVSPRHAELHSNRGAALAGLGRLQEAEQAYRRAIALKPDFGDAHNNLGNVLCDLGRLDEAEAALRTAVKLKPESSRCRSNLGTVLRSQGRLIEAEAAYRDAIALDENCADAYNNLGEVLRELCRFDEAELALRCAIAIEPQHADAHVNKALLRLLDGDFARGWIEYEWRVKLGSQAVAPRSVGLPLWTGAEAIEGRTLLIHGEQGFGDTIQFCRYLPLLVARGARVVFEVAKPLAGLMTHLAGAIEVVSNSDPLPDADFYCPLLSLPLAFGTRLESIPAAVPYLSAPLERIRDWGMRLQPRSRPRVGLAWSGRKSHKNDRDRSIDLSLLLPLLDVGATFVSLQKEVRPGDPAILSQRSEIFDDIGSLNDFSETAALISQLDLVISVDTAVAHLAGALAKPVWVLLPRVPDWRWQLERNDSPWYPSARLFRQSDARRWDLVIDEVRAALSSFVARKRNDAA